MSKCSQCRKIKLDTTWDKLRMFLHRHLFCQDMHDEKADSYTQGFSDGLKEGRKIEYEHQKEIAKRYFNIEL